MNKMYWTAGALSALLIVGPATLQAAEAKPAAPSSAKDQKNTPVTEAELADWLVRTLGLTRALPVNPSAQECFAALLQNGIQPKLGWNSTNTVTMGNLARIVVQSLRKADEVKNPDQDASWINWLTEHHIHTDTITLAVDALNPLDPAYVAEAAIVSTDPLVKQARSRPPDADQFGADLSAVTMPQIVKIFGEVPSYPFNPPPPPPAPPKPPRPSPRPPMTRT